MPSLDLLSWHSYIKRLIRSFMIVVVLEASYPLFRAGLTAPPKRVKAVDSHGHSLEPLFDMVPSVMVEPTDQFVTREGSQIATGINKKLRVGKS
jgi:hypothetical protein